MTLEELLQKRIDWFNKAMQEYLKRKSPARSRNPNRAIYYEI